jgi:hypothetical protein
MTRTVRMWLTMLMAGSALAILGATADAAKQAFTRTKPHVSVGSIGGIPAMIWFHANAVVFDDGDGAGIVQLAIVDGDTLLYRVIGGTVDVAEGAIIEMRLFLERVGGAGDDVIILRPGRPGAEDELIYNLVGANIQGRAEGVLGFALRSVPLPPQRPQ